MSFKAFFELSEKKTDKEKKHSLSFLPALFSCDSPAWYFGAFFQVTVVKVCLVAGSPQDLPKDSMQQNSGSPRLVLGQQHQRQLGTI